ncbi:hypothetical protein I4F81_004631 [Pyropia yezoensis]|uniref:Uncharacterized protein n=1 Tax=Pyropia yezoensis TaxID=2788 RepID=A0ACC3BWD6_PYRYE|nr:hypothetical protein I4F81_004631 [Neopyropia yezoensis]|eukprot:contig_8434_g1978
MMLKRRPPALVVLAVSFTVLIGRVLWVSTPQLVTAVGTSQWAVTGVRADGSPLSRISLPFPSSRAAAAASRPCSGRRATAPAEEAPLSPLTQRRLTQHSAEPTPEVDLAYFVQVSPSNVALLPRLMAATYHVDNVYAVHFDLKIDADVMATTIEKVAIALAEAEDTAGEDETPNPMQRKEGPHPRSRRGVALPHNVLIMDRTPVTYRGITTVLNTLDGMSAVLAYTHPSSSSTTGGDSIATMGKLMRAADDNARPPWTYFINLSGSDYPLLSPTAMRRLLARPNVAARGANFLTLHPRDGWELATRNRYRRLVVDTGVGVLGQGGLAEAVDTTVKPARVDHPLWEGVDASPASPPSAEGGASPGSANPPPALLAKGGAWMIATRAFAVYATSSGDARRALVAMANGLSSSEHYFPTLLLGPAWRRTLLPHSLRAVYWDPAWSGGVPLGEMQHPNTIDPVVSAEREELSVTSPSGDEDTPPATAGPFGPRIATSPYLFARKFSRPDAPLLDWIDAHRLGRGARRDGLAGKAAAEARAATHLEWLLRLPPQEGIGA